ncbi:uncharacterized protein V6R79_019588 [Siganus canaliculatus]
MSRAAAETLNKSEIVITLGCIVQRDGKELFGLTNVLQFSPRGSVRRHISSARLCKDTAKFESLQRTPAVKDGEGEKEMKRKSVLAVKSRRHLREEQHVNSSDKREEIKGLKPLMWPGPRQQRRRRGNTQTRTEARSPAHPAVDGSARISSEQSPRRGARSGPDDSWTFHITVWIWFTAPLPGSRAPGLAGSRAQLTPNSCWAERATPSGASFSISAGCQRGEAPRARHFLQTHGRTGTATGTGRVQTARKSPDRQEESRPPGRVQTTRKSPDRQEESRPPGTVQTFRSSPD